VRTVGVRVWVGVKVGVCRYTLMYLCICEYVIDSCVLSC